MEAQAIPPGLKTIPKSSPFGALLSRTLPSYTGPHAVGVCDVEVPVTPQTFGTFTHKSMPNKPAGLQMDTVLFSIFYPVDEGEIQKDNKHVVWFPKLKQTVDGFLQMASRTPNWILKAVSYPIAALAIYGTTFPAFLNAFLRRPSSDMDAPPVPSYPLMIFSHGVGCSRLMYSAFCGEMASRGWIVCVIEHRDGTSPSSTIVTEDGKSQELDWITWKDLYWPELGDNQPKDDTTLRHEQVKMRLAEIHEVIGVMGRINQGEDIVSTKAKKAKEKDKINVPDTKFEWERWKGSINMDKIVMAGHSFGGTAAIASTPDTRFSFESIIAMDPAIQRIDPWTTPIAQPVLTINSEEFTRTDDWGRLKNLAHYARSIAITQIPGSTHPSFSDLPLILPAMVNRLTGLKIPDRDVLDLSVRVTNAFLKGNGNQNTEISTDGGVKEVRKKCDGTRTWDELNQKSVANTVENVEAEAPNSPTPPTSPVTPTSPTVKDKDGRRSSKDEEKKQKEGLKRRKSEKSEKSSKGKILWCVLEDSEPNSVASAQPPAAAAVA